MRTVDLSKSRLASDKEEGYTLLGKSVRGSGQRTNWTQVVPGQHLQELTGGAPHWTLSLLCKPAMAQAAGLFTCCLTHKVIHYTQWCLITVGSAVIKEHIGPKGEKKMLHSKATGTREKQVAGQHQCRVGANYQQNAVLPRVASPFLKGQRKKSFLKIQPGSCSKGDTLISWN